MWWKLVKAIITIIGVVSVFLGLPGTVKDVEGWKDWLQQSIQFINLTPLGATLVVIGVLLIVGVNLPRSAKRSMTYLPLILGSLLTNVRRVLVKLKPSTRLKIEILESRFLFLRDLPYPGLDNVPMEAQILEVTITFRTKNTMQIARVELLGENSQIRAANNPVYYLQGNETYSFVFLSSHFSESKVNEPKLVKIRALAGGETWKSDEFLLPTFGKEPDIASAEQPPDLRVEVTKARPLSVNNLPPKYGNVTNLRPSDKGLEITITLSSSREIQTGGVRLIWGEGKIPARVSALRPLIGTKTDSALFVISEDEVTKNKHEPMASISVNAEGKSWISDPFKMPDLNMDINIAAISLLETLLGDGESLMLTITTMRLFPRSPAAKKALLVN